MSAAENVLEIIVSEFPEHKKEITELYDKSNSFIEICEDFVVCLGSIKKLELMDNPKKQKEINDLKQVMIELREELISKI